MENKKKGKLETFAYKFGYVCGMIIFALLVILVGIAVGALAIAFARYVL